MTKECVLIQITVLALWAMLEKDARKEVSKAQSAPLLCIQHFFVSVESECDDEVNMCENNGTCVQHARSITCNCPMGFIGIFCQEKGRAKLHCKLY